MQNSINIHRGWSSLQRQSRDRTLVSVVTGGGWGGRGCNVTSHLSSDGKVDAIIRQVSGKVGDVSNLIVSAYLDMETKPMPLHRYVRISQPEKYGLTTIFTIFCCQWNNGKSSGSLKAVEGCGGGYYGLLTSCEHSHWAVFLRHSLRRSSISTLDIRVEY